MRAPFNRNIKEEIEFNSRAIMMNILPINLSILFLVGGISSTSFAVPTEINCRDFAALSGVSTHEDYKKSKSTEEQYNAFRAVIAKHAGRIADLNPSSRRNAALQLVLKNKELKAMIIGNAFEMTVDFCVDRKNAPMRDVAIEQFDYLLDAVEKNMGK